MKFQPTQKRIVNTLLIGAVAITIASLQVQPANAQMSRSAFREAARELDLNRSQMREIGGIMKNSKSELQAILTPEQFELLQSARQQAQTQAQARNPEQFKSALGLTDIQAAQLAALHEGMIVQLQEILTPDQLEGIMELTAFSQL